MAAWKSSPLSSTTVQLLWALGSVLGGWCWSWGSALGRNLVSMLQLSLGCFILTPPNGTKPPNKPRLPEVTPASPGIFLSPQGGAHSAPAPVWGLDEIPQLLHSPATAPAVLLAECFVGARPGTGKWPLRL